MRGIVLPVRLSVLMVAMVAIVGGFFATASAERYTGGSYVIDASVVGNSLGGTQTGGSYSLESSGGESIIGQGSGGSYKLDAGYVAQLPHSMQLTVQPGGLIGYFPFDNIPKNGQFTDTSTTNIVMETVGATFTSAAGKVGSAAVLNGTDNYINSVANNLGTYEIAPGASLTAEGWFKRSTTNAHETLYWNDHACQGWSVSIQGDDHVTADYTGGTGCGSDISQYATSTSAITDTNWHHFAAVYNRSAGTIKLYLDGVYDVATSTSLDTTSTTPGWHTLSIGGDWQPSNYFHGSLDEFKIFNRGLSAQEIKAEYDGQSAGNNSGLHLGSIIPNASNTSPFDAIIESDALGYTLAINQNQNLTNGGNTIPAISGSIASPAAWSEGTTKGLGFTLISSNGTAIDGKWNAGASYAALPGTATSVYTRTGTQSSKDVLNMRLRADVANTQTSGAYSNVVTITSTYTP